MVSHYRIIRIRRWITAKLRRAHLHLLAAQFDPGVRVRLWDGDWNLRGDSDRGDRIDFATVDLDSDRTVVYEPATTVRWSLPC
jgi:hypothetical protein